MSESPWLRVYLSGPISKGDHEHNFQQAARAHLDLLRLKFAVLNPMLSMRLPGHETIPHASWMSADLPWVEMADAVLRLPGESVGADLETKHAEEHGIPVFHGMADLFAWRVALMQPGVIRPTRRDVGVRSFSLGTE